ncbi:cytochrome P450 [Daedaleopsis nitida]|nr:cytochrome P450 [Daedaleopsis nitida]
MQVFLLTIILATATALVAILRRRHHRSLKNIRGPTSPSLIFGHDVAINRQSEVGELDFKWMNEYGSAWRIRGHLCAASVACMLVVPNARQAMQHVFHKSGYNYVKRRDVDTLTKLFLGPGIVAATGETHQRHRKIMNPAFSAPQLRTFLGVFQDIGQKMCEKWKNEVVDSSPKTVLVNKWLARTTLDIIGAAAFDYDYGALDNTESELAKVYGDLFIDTALHIPKWLIFYRTMWNYLPDWILRYVGWTPTKEHRRLRRTNKVIRKIGARLLGEKVQEVSGKASGQKDVLSILIKANLSEDPRTQLQDEEMMAQMQSLTFAGHETTASTLSWMFWELAKHPKYQARMRAEIRATRAAVVARGDDRFSIDDLDSMTTVLNAIKETLRFHPIVFNLQRVAAKDDIIPLAEPIRTTTGEMINAIPVKAGQWINASLCAYNRVPSVWGEDADSWDPDRFLRIDPTKQIRVGMFANLYVLHYVNHTTCVLTMLVLIEMQALASELLERFEFGLPEEKFEVVRVPAGLMIPLVRDRMDLGIAMPLTVSVGQ